MKNVIKPTTKWDDWRTEIEVAQKCTIEKMAGVYMVPELTAPATRPGADDHAQYPSRRGNVLFYKDGKKERVPT
jgi:hypothetical protein